MPNKLVWQSADLKLHGLPPWWLHHGGRPGLRGVKPRPSRWGKLRTQAAGAKSDCHTLQDFFRAPRINQVIEANKVIAPLPDRKDSSGEVSPVRTLVTKPENIVQNKNGENNLADGKKNKKKDDDGDSEEVVDEEEKLMMMLLMIGGSSSNIQRIHK